MNILRRIVVSLLAMAVASGVCRSQSLLTAAEYFIDNDPGIGNATAVPGFASSGNIDITFTAAVSGLSQGMHVLGVRVKDDSDTWSIPSFTAFYVFPYNSVASQTIAQAEYFFDSDPGESNGISIPVTPGAAVDVSYLAATAALTPGMHLIGVRTRSSAGLWSVPAFSAFYVDFDRNIDKVEYYIDADPGPGNATQIPVTPQTANLDVDVVIPTSSLPPGTHTVGVRAGRMDDMWSATATTTFTVCSYANASFSADAVCIGTPTSFTDTSTGTLTGDNYRWDFDGDGTIDNTTAGNTTFSYAAPGTYNAVLEIDRSGCVDVFSATVTVNAAAVADAGADQNICVDNSVLSANAPSAGQTGIWTIISGTATIGDPADPASAITGISSHTTVLQWTVSAGGGSCAGTDQVTIVSNQPISAGQVNAAAALGQTSTIDVKGSATVNPGDLLTTTIVSMPQKGSASISPDGSISYTPNEGTVGRDTLTFRLCNQCARCSTAILVVDIQNNAPLISPEPVAANGEQAVVDLLSIISDPNNNLDLSTLAITQQPQSGAVATIDGSYRLIVDYSGVYFSGTDLVTVRVCDFAGICTSNVIAIEVVPPADPPVTVYNAVSPNADGKHDYLEIENIEAYPANTVYVFNRWGVRVFEMNGYDNDQKRFTGAGNVGGAGDLPAGTYYYNIDLGNGSRISGYLLLRK